MMFPRPALVQTYPTRLFVHVLWSRLSHCQLQASTVAFHELCTRNRGICRLQGSGIKSLNSDKEKHVCTPNHARLFSVKAQTLQQQQKAKPSKSKDIIETEERSFGELTTSQKVAQVGKDITYTGVVIVGIAVTGFMFYVIGRELFSGQSPSGIYDRAFKLCKKHEELTCAIGTPIKGYGELSSRGRRRHVSHWEFERDGIKHMRMKFYIEGPDGKGTVHLEAKQDERGKYDFRYLFVELEGTYPRTFVIVDNR